ncbi:MAG: hypothetical protein K8J08_02500 [Thermoanaerobaculia bacterium]|nr:hypothetical protein [Thermoanaerobaculia bacterium]
MTGRRTQRRPARQERAPRALWIRAVGLGILGALIGAGAYWGVIRITGYEVGLLAIGVGLVVGFAVRLGSRAWGGLGFQVLAMLLTYLAIVVTYSPTVADELRRSETPSMESAVPDTKVTPSKMRSDREDSLAATDRDGAGVLRSVRAAGLFALLVLAVPMMGGGTAGAGGWLFLILAVLQAAILNRSAGEDGRNANGKKRP